MDDLDRSFVESVVDEYGEAWMAQDEERITLIFSEDALYVEHPYDPKRTYEGRSGIRDYWIRQIQTKQRKIKFTHRRETLLVDKERRTALAKWEASFMNVQRDGITFLPVEFVQVAMLTFNESGLITRLEEYWTSKGKYEKGRQDKTMKRLEEQQLKKHPRALDADNELGPAYPCGALADPGKYIWATRLPCLVPSAKS